MSAVSETSLSAGSFTALINLSCPRFFSRLKKYLLHFSFCSRKAALERIFAPSACVSSNLLMLLRRSEASRA